MCEKQRLFCLLLQKQQGRTRVRTPEQEAHWLKSNTDQLQPLPNPETGNVTRTEGADGTGGVQGSEPDRLCRCIHVRL